MQGFASLTEFRTGPAKKSFARAIALDQADPLPRLGLGLAMIREGDLEGGRGEIDAAVALDSNRSLLRSYLGKAYFEEDRNGLASEQFELAKQLDPKDPTPWLYEGIQLQTENRPGEALESIQESIRLNGNRAVFRSRLALDQDEAARSASLGRVFDDLGFTELGMREATGSQTLDPANASAHRFLADIYRNERRRELSRVSELTRSQLLQDINLYPVQPSLTETNLNLVARGGPANAGFNEFNSLFASDGTRFTASGVAGNDSTFGGEAAFAMQQENVSVSFGGFEYGSDGFRPNFDVTHRIYDLFAQYAVSPELNLQVEGRLRHTENGDLNLNFDPDTFDPNFNQTLDEASIRTGLRFSPDPHNTTLASFIYADRDTEQESSAFVPNSGPDCIVAGVDAKSWLGELQHIYQQDAFNITVGGAAADTDESLPISFRPDAIPIDIPFGTLNISTEAYRAYAYGTLELPYGFTVIAGASYDDYESGETDISRVNPKAGIEWQPLPDVTFRAAYAAVVKPPLATNRTIEPTQVAGFNQYFDDANGTKSERWGVGGDWAITDTLFMGAEMTWRNLDVPYTDFDPTTFETFGAFADHEERTHRVYLNALPHPRVPVSVAFVYDLFKAEQNLLTLDPTASVPLRAETISVPVTVRYFDPSGVFAGVRGTYVHQEVERAPGNDFADGTSNFFNLDLEAGYRFPNQRGSVSLALRNVLDQDFEFQDDGYREFGDEPSTGPYFPSIGVMGRLTINF